ncbi:MAG TPA: NACHT domain-containing protein, partial [Kofleriaceae bacterium]|nr:NACHT domain-containing protein [Kofleriaceae bacterium]
RWTFRKLIGNPRAVPFFLELRAIAASWKTPHDAASAFDSYLADELTRCQIPDAKVVVAALLREPAGPQPVLLIDGWDELGSQGERVRERLAEFCNAFPNVVVMVSSRPTAISLLRVRESSRPCTSSRCPTARCGA